MEFPRRWVNSIVQQNSSRQQIPFSRSTVFSATCVMWVSCVDATDGRFYCGACWGEFLIADARAQMARQHAVSNDGLQSRSAMRTQMIRSPQHDRGASSALDRMQRTGPQTTQPAAAVARARLASSGNRNVRGVFSASGQRATPPTRPRSRRVDAAANRPHGSDADSDSDQELPVVSLHAMDSLEDLRADLLGVRQELERKGGAELFGVRQELERIQHRIEGDSDGERASSVEADAASLDWESFAEPCRGPAARVTCHGNQDSPRT